MTETSRRDVLLRRLATQRLQGEGLPSAADVVRLLGCVQSQEYAHALWSLGMRSSAQTVADVQAEFDRGEFLRTHILRPTWHFVAAEDIRWILKATAPRVQQLNQTIYRQVDLDPDTRDRGIRLIVEELEGDGIGPGPSLDGRWPTEALSVTGLSVKGCGWPTSS